MSKVRNNSNTSSCTSSTLYFCDVPPAAACLLVLQEPCYNCPAAICLLQASACSSAKPQDTCCACCT
jgi:hypothetical protein